MNEAECDIEFLVALPSLGNREMKQIGLGATTQIRHCQMGAELALEGLLENRLQMGDELLGEMHGKRIHCHKRTNGLVIMVLVILQSQNNFVAKLVCRHLMNLLGCGAWIGSIVGAQMGEDAVRKDRVVKTVQHVFQIAVELDNILAG